MKLKKFIQKLERIARDHGGDTRVAMADSISVVNPVFSEKYPSKKSVVITDKK